MMSTEIKFPDAIVFPNGTIRLISSNAKSWAYSRTDLKRDFRVESVPNYVAFDDAVAESMAEDGLLIRRERQPVGHYRSKRRRWPNKKISNDTTVIDFLQRIPEQAREDAMFRAYGRHKRQAHRGVSCKDE
jgi:hypothetical protein